MKVADGAAGGPRRDERCPAGPGHDRLAVVDTRPAGNGHAHAIDLQPVEPLDAGADDLVVPPADEPVGRGAVEEVVLARAFPDEVPAVLGIDPDGPAATTGPYLERACHRPGRPSLAVFQRVRIVTRR